MSPEKLFFVKRDPFWFSQGQENLDSMNLVFSELFISWEIFIQNFENRKEL